MYLHAYIHTHAYVLYRREEAKKMPRTHGCAQFPGETDRLKREDSDFFFSSYEFRVIIEI